MKALFAGLIPFLAICFSVPLWNRASPVVFGLPFNLFWLMAWIFLTPVCMYFAYRFEMARLKEREKEAGQDGGGPAHG